MTSKPTTIAIIGAGGRGSSFASLIENLPHLGTVVAVAEPRAAYRERLAKQFSLPPERVFERWQDFVAEGKLCDAVVIATMDQDHVGPAVACTELGCHMLLEKPMAVALEDCRVIAEAQRKAGTITAVCHSMRYHKGFAKLKEVVDSGRLGRIVTVDQLEQVAWWHQAHSFVRGNWGNEARSTFMLLAKSCHDIDYLAHLIGTPCQRVGSFGALTYFRPEYAPEGSTERCVDCPVEPDCAYSALRHYVYTNREGWPAAVVSPDHSLEAHLKAVTEGPYGRCVWKTDNDVVDHQVVMMEFEGDVTVTFTMTAFTQHGGRRVRVHGTLGEAHFEERKIEVRDFASGNTETITIGPEPGGHGGGDRRVLLSWLNAIASRDASLVRTDVQESYHTHRIVFAAERARREGRLIVLDEFEA
ncbi:MAG: gfo/Idh/MocA family oxidoreductase [Puniceicoccaceae bacterium]|nr:MAG: gfo/Idh/MocA family oxidoreductase [Puniceicoccaceae bacterium]